MGKKLYEFTWYCGRQGTLEGRFVLNDQEQAMLNALYGKVIDFGEALGKHSQIRGPLLQKDIAVITDNEGFIDTAAVLKVDLNFGYNPLSYYLGMVADGLAEPLDVSP